MSEDIQAACLERLDALCAKLGVGSELLWQVLVRQWHYNGIRFALVASCFLVIAVVAGAMTPRVANSDDDDVSVTTFFALIAIGSFIATAILSFYALGYWWNPEYYAAREIMDVLR